MEYVENMTWREFQLRRAGYLRHQKEDWKKSRMVAYYALAATGAIDTHKMSIEKFMPLDGTPAKAQIDNTARARLREVQEEYNKKQNVSRT